MVARRGGCTARPSDQTFVCVWSSTGRKKAMLDHVPRDRVRLAAPRMQRLSAQQEHEATRLLAALLTDAARAPMREGNQQCRADRCSVLFSDPASVRPSGWTRGPSSVQIPSKQARSTTGKNPDNRGGS